MQKEGEKSNLAPNNDFLSSKPEKTELTPLQKEVADKNEKAIQKNTKQQEKIDKFKNKAIKEERIEGFDEYYELNAYERKTLDADNYWRVMWGQKIIEVPPTDIHYHTYFDKKCYDLADKFQARKKLEKEEILMRQEKEKSNVKVEPVIEPVVETVVKIDEVKEEINVTTVTHNPISIEPQEKLSDERIQEINEILAPIMDDSTQNNNIIVKEEKKSKPKKDEGQGSLF